MDIFQREGVMKKSLLGLILGIAFLFGNIQEASAIEGRYTLGIPTLGWGV